MNRVALCARPGCQGSATAWLTYDYQDRRVWLDSRPDPGAGDQWPLCARHAEGLRVPQGWEQTDRRRVGAPRPIPTEPGTVVKRAVDSEPAGPVSGGSGSPSSLVS